MAIVVQTFQMDAEATDGTITTSGTIDSVNTQNVACYLDTVEAAQQNEILNGWKTLLDFARETALLRSAGTTYFMMPLGGAKADRRNEAILTNLEEGEIALGISGNVRVREQGNLLVVVAFDDLFDAVSEQFLKLR